MTMKTTEKRMLQLTTIKAVKPKLPQQMLKTQKKTHMQLIPMRVMTTKVKKSQMTNNRRKVTTMTTAMMNQPSKSEKLAKIVKLPPNLIPLMIYYWYAPAPTIFIV